MFRLSGGIPPSKKSKNPLDRRNIDRIREGYSEKRRFIPKIRDKRASVRFYIFFCWPQTVNFQSDSSSKLDDKDRIVRLRKSRQELRKTSKDDDRGV